MMQVPAQQLRLGDPGVLRAQGMDLPAPTTPSGGRRGQRHGGHEVALARSEGAVDVGRAADAVAHGDAHEVEGVVERVHDAGRDGVLAHEHVGVLDAVGELDDERGLGGLARDVEEFAEGAAHRSGALQCPQKVDRRAGATRGARTIPEVGASAARDR
ncbi:MAG: hypothetical protein IPN17_38755 [Deltaproteobacteria bacterium]|nr:hypothetical protein [Deltaproteobacteria bacterium]